MKDIFKEIIRRWFPRAYDSLDKTPRTKLSLLELNPKIKYFRILRNHINPIKCSICNKSILESYKIKFTIPFHGSKDFGVEIRLWDVQIN